MNTYVIASTENETDAGHTVYLFELVCAVDGRILDKVTSKSPIAPRKIRERCARLNSATYLDNLLHG